MLVELELHTLVVALAIINALQLLAIFFQYRINRAYQSIRWWLLGSAVVAIGYISLLLRETASISQISIVLSNVLFISGLIFYYFGITQFLEKRDGRKIIILSLTAYIITIIFFTYANDNIEARTVIQSASIAIISFLTVHALLSKRPRTIATSINFMAIVIMAQACFFTFRTAYVLAFPLDNIFTPTLTQTIMFVFVLIVGFLYTFGFIFMVNQRLTSELQEAKEHFELIFNTSPDAAFITRPEDGRVINVNDRFSELTGYTRTETIGKTSLAIWKKPEDRQKVVNILREKGFCDNFEAEFLRKDGSQLTGVISARIIVKDGAPYIMSVTRDITDRKQAEENLRETKEYLQNLLDHANAPIIVWSPELVITIFNRAFEKLTGMSSEQVVGKPLEILFPIETRSTSMNLIRQTTIGERWEDVEIPIRGKDGSVRTVLWNSATLTSSGGATIATIAQGQDITERKRAEAALREANRKLNLLSSITRHDINNQLIALAGNLTLLERKQLERSSSEHLRKAEAAAERISAMIRFTKEYEDIGVNAPAWHDVRALVRTGSGDVPLEKVRVLDDVPEGAEVFADPLITKVFHNLMTNSVRHGSNITYIRFSLEKNDGVYAICCEDDGVGISEEMKEMLFTKGSGKDHGLGLFLSREILGITGITIVEEGEQGKGAKFVMTIPDGGLRGPNKVGTSIYDPSNP
jgi:PAS domain S-box-containing protein